MARERFGLHAGKTFIHFRGLKVINSQPCSEDVSLFVSLFLALKKCARVTGHTQAKVEKNIGVDMTLGIGNQDPFSTAALLLPFLLLLLLLLLVLLRAVEH